LEKRIEVYVEKSCSEEFEDLTVFDESNESQNMIDLIVCLGGDGTILHANTFFKQSMPPVMSFSLGSLGFLTEYGEK
jgi:NAD+ kinase